MNNLLFYFFVLYVIFKLHEVKRARHFLKTSLLLAFILPFFAYSQNDNLKIGDWKHHFSFNDCFSIIETPTQIIGASSLGLNIFTNNDQSLSSLTKINGLSDYNLSAIAYLPDNNTIIIGYTNGNIDLIENGSVYNINDLKIKQMDGSKRINHFLNIDNTIYCSTDFGIILINTDKKEISSSWYIGEEASGLQIFQLVTDGNSLYAATNKGVRKTSLLGSNPEFFENWQTISPTSNPYISIALFSGRLIAALGQKGQTCSLQSFQDNIVTTFASVSYFYSMNISASELIVTSGNAIRFFNSSLQLTEPISSPYINETTFSPAFRNGILDKNNNLWVADNSKGLLKRVSNNYFTPYNMQGPASNQCKQLLLAGSNLWIVAGGLTSSWNNAGIKASSSVLTSMGWQHITYENSLLLENIIDLIGVSANPLNPNHIFINSWGQGVFELEEEEGTFYVKNNFNKSETGLQNIDWAAPSGYVRIGATAFDKNNTLFITNSQVDNGLVAYFPEDQSFFRLNYQSIKATQGLGTMLMPSSGDKWMIIGRGTSKGLFIWNDNDTPKNQSDDKYRSAILPADETDTRNKGQLLLWDDNGEVITNNIFSIAEDHNGYIWIGTDVGIVVQYQPRKILTKEKPIFSRIKISRNDESGLADYLLENETVTSIVVDAGNRKWIGTQDAGVFLVSADGTRTVSSYNTTNSPIPSNYITSIAINNETGEVIIATDNGVIATRGSATKGMDKFNNIYAFPNPVKPNFYGTITITGLMTKSNVKITDVTGKLVYETTSVGGQAFWDGCNFWGEKVKSGIYLVFVASEDASESEVTKIAIIR